MSFRIFECCSSLSLSKLTYTAALVVTTGLSVFRAIGSFLLVLREIATATPPLTAFPMRWASLRLTPATGLLGSAVLPSEESCVRMTAALRDPLPRLETGNPCRKEGVFEGEGTRFCWVAAAMPLKAPLPDRTCGGLYWKACCCCRCCIIIP